MKKLVVVLPILTLFAAGFLLAAEQKADINKKAPAEVTANAQSDDLNAEQEFRKLRSSYNKALTNVVETEKSVIDFVNRQYVESIRELFKTAATIDGDLQKSKAILAEETRFEKEMNIRPETIAQSLPDIQKLQKAYLERRAGVELQYSKQIINIAERYETLLKEMRQQLTKKLKLDEATDVDNEISSITKNEKVASAKTIISGGQSEITKNAINNTAKEIEEKKPAEVKTESKSSKTKHDDKAAEKKVSGSAESDRYSDDEVTQNSIDFFFKKLSAQDPKRNYYAAMWALGRKCELQEDLEREILSRTIKLFKKEKNNQMRIKYMGVLAGPSTPEGSQEAYQTVLDALNHDKDPEIRGFAAYSMLFQKKKDSAIDDLQKALKTEKSPSVRKSIENGIENIKKYAR